MNSKLTHYIKSAWNNFRHNKWYISLMVLSLAIGMFSFVVASIYISFEYNRNSNHKDADRVFRLMVEVKDGGITYLPNPFASELKEKHPEIEAASLVDGIGGKLYLTTNEEDYYSERKAYYANKDFFKVFDFPLLYGSIEGFSNTSSAIISSHLADLLFNGVNPVGKTLKVHNVGDFLDAGVMKEVPEESLLDPGIVINRAFYHKIEPKAKGYGVNFTYAKIKEGVNLDELKERLFQDFDQMYGDKYPDRFGAIYSERLSEAYWGSSIGDYVGGIQNSSFIGANKQKINTIGYLALGILVCGIVGFLSLSLGLSNRRSKEIGVRKVNGARQSDIQLQLLSEALFYVFSALVIVLVALEITGNYFTELFGVPIGMDYTSPDMIVQLLVFTVITGLLAGVYPSFIISKLNPVIVLKGKSSAAHSAFGLKRVLSIVQLSVAVLLVFGTLVQFEQSKTMMAFDFGYGKENLIALRLERESKVANNKVAVLEAVNDIKGVNSTSGGPFPLTFNGYSNYRYDKGDSLLEGQVARVNVAQNFFEFLQVDIVQGESFLTNKKQSENVCIVNEAMANLLGGNVVGQLMDYGGANLEIIGVSKDYTDWGLSRPKADPRVFINSTDKNYHSILIRHSGENKAAVISALEGVWRTYEKIILPSVIDLETKRDSSAKGVEKSTVLGAFLSIMILILSLLNLLGYSVMYANAKVKAISIRKILGAEALELFIRLVKPFFYNLTISLLIALPIAYWLMEQYLNDYAVRMSLSASEGIIVGAVMAILVLFVIGFQLLKVSKANPAEVLKAE